jgi:hypothetical protein
MSRSDVAGPTLDGGHLKKNVVHTVASDTKGLDAPVAEHGNPHSFERRLLVLFAVAVIFLLGAIAFYILMLNRDLKATQDRVVGLQDHIDRIRFAVDGE